MVVQEETCLEDCGEEEDWVGSDSSDPDFQPLESESDEDDEGDFDESEINEINDLLEDAKIFFGDTFDSLSSKLGLKTKDPLVAAPDTSDTADAEAGPAVTAAEPTAFGVSDGYEESSQSAKRSRHE